MKKFFAVLMAAVLLILPVSLSACASDIPKEIDSDDWVEVYQIDTGNLNITSEWIFNYKEENITEEEYAENTFLIGTQGIIPRDKSERDDLLKNLSENVGKKTYNRYVNNGEVRYKATTYTDYELHYVRVKFFDDGSLGINYNESTIRILPETYTITYFNN